MIWAVLLLLSASAFGAVMIFERRSVLSGFLLLCTVVMSGVFLLSMAQRYPDWFSAHIFAHILLDMELIILAILLVAYPLVMIPVFFVEGIILIKREGVRFRNVLSLGLAAALLMFDIIFPFIFDLNKRGIMTYIYWYLTLISLYFIIQLSSFFISNFLNLIHFKKNHGLSHIIVLGCGLSGTKPTPLLKARIDKGIEVYKNNPGSKLVFSGGQGSDEQIPESHAMAEYALSAGVKSGDIIKEDRSKNTIENLRFSNSLIKEDLNGNIGRTALVTSSYHVIRSLIITRRLKMPCIGYGAKTRFYFSLNAFLREYIGYFRDSRVTRLLHLALLTLIYLIFVAHIIK